MRDYERIRKIKGRADALALEECRYTKPESGRRRVRRGLAVARPSRSSRQWKSEVVEQAAPSSWR